MKLDVLRPERVIDLRPLARAHSAIDVGANGLRLGAFAKMSSVAEHPGVLAGYPAIAQSLQLAASAQLRNMATLGGNVLQKTRCTYYRDPSWSACNKRNPGSGCAAIAGFNRNHAILGVDDSCISQYPGDFAVALIALDAQLELAGPQGPRDMGFSSLHTPVNGQPHVETTLRSGELITGFLVPPGAWNRRSVYLKVRDRSSYEFAISSAAVALDIDGDSVRTARVGLGTKASAATRLNLDPDNVRAISRYIGGAFGSKGPNPRTAWIAIAAKRVGRPVKLVPTRDQGFTIATYRAETRQHIKLGATADGKLISFSHEGWEVTSRPSGYNVAGVESTARMYACDNIATAVNVVHADRNTPGYMRAPPETPYMFALESAMDELAHQLRMDPIELRRINDTQLDPVAGIPFSSRSLMKCFDQGAARFGWSRRTPDPGSMHEGEWMIGYGCATACYPTNIGPAAARVSVTPNGKAEVGLAGHEIGTGAYTTVAITAARSLGLKVEDVTVRMGDSNLPPIMIAGGSNNAASATHVVAKACEELRRRIAEAAVKAEGSTFHGAEPSALRLENGALLGPQEKSGSLAAAMSRTGHRLEAYAENVPDGLPATAFADLVKGKPAMLSGASRKDVTAFAFGAHFVEVRVHSRTREIRVPRVVSAFAAGTIVNPKTAYSQFMGGAIWGLSSALFEETEMDKAAARYVNHNLADYLIPVNADVPSIEVLMVPEQDDRVNPLGIKGIGEIGIVGMNAAVANAVFHATGKRIRELPIRAEKLL